MPFFKAIRAVALFEGLKGIVVLLAATGLLALVHHDVRQLAARLIEHAHLNPASKYPKIFIDASAQLTDPHLWWLAACAAMYAMLRLVEGYGLYNERAWAEVLAALSGAIYVPFEVIELVHRPTGLAATLLVTNLAVVALMVSALNARRKTQRPMSQTSGQNR
jgi:uncharacterized membrane protein (DUF2068 family)